VGISFHTPEEYFLNEEPQPFIRLFDPSKYIVSDAVPNLESGKQPSHFINAYTISIDANMLLGLPASAPFIKANEVDIVLFCGCPGAGKSTFYWKQLEPLGYARVNQDILKSVSSLCALFFR
jgi:bifunctional polynucleotide phosphatase/kinase